MKLEELHQVWQQYDQKLDRYLELNHKVLREINLQKARSLLRWIIIRSLLEMSFFLGAAFALTNLMVNHFDRMPLFISALVLNIFALIGLAGSTRQIVIISQIDYAESIISIQKKLQQLRTHIIQNLKLILLSIPFYLAYPVLGFYILWDIDLYTQGDRNWWIAQIAFSIILIPVVVWLYRKIHYRNLHVRWVRSLIHDAGGKSVAKAMGLLNELEEFEQD